MMDGLTYGAVFFYLDLGISARTTFLIDTGADCTVLQPLDVKRLKIPVTKLKGVLPVSGIKGETIYFQEEALLLFAEGNSTIRGYSIQIGVAPLDANSNYTLPSLLGQEILRYWRMRHDPATGRLEFTVKGADFTFRGDLTTVAKTLVL